jgi:hypothetical protein
MNTNPNNKCDSCEKTFSSKSSLNVHLKKTKSCGTGIKTTYDCSHCSKKFTQKNNLDYHLTNSCEGKKKEETRSNEELKAIIIEKDKKLEENEKKFKDQDEYYDKLIVSETMSKEKLKSEARVKEAMYKETIEKLERTIEALHEKLERMAATRPTSTVNNINNSQNITLNMFITPEFVRTQAAKYLTYDHFANGLKGLANFVHDYVLMDKNGKLLYACYDKARHILRYRDDQGNEIDDVDAEKLIAIVSQPIKDKHAKICKELKEDIERYKRILEDDEESYGAKKEIKEKLDKAALSLRVMEFQSDGIQQIGLSANKELARSLEKVCLLPKVGLKKLPPVVEQVKND